MSYKIKFTFKRRLSYSLLFVFCAGGFNLTLAKDNTVKDLIRDAFLNTYKEGLINYNCVYRSVTTKGDTFTVNSTNTAIISKKDVAFTSISQDSFMAVSLDNILLVANINRRTYRKLEIDKERKSEIYDRLFPALYKRKLWKTVLGGAERIEELSNSPSKVVYRIWWKSQDDIQAINFIIGIDKINNIVADYTFNASVATVSIWNSCSINSIDRSDAAVDFGIVKTSFDDVMNNYLVETKKPVQQIIDSIEAKFVEFQSELPGMDLISLNGDTAKLSETRSKYHLVDFWYRACYPCIKTMPVIKELYSKYDRSILNIISINNVDKSGDQIEEFVNTNQVKYPVYLESIQTGKYFKGISGYPTLILYDDKFNVLATYGGYTDKLLRDIESHILN